MHGNARSNAPLPLHGHRPDRAIASIGLILLFGSLGMACGLDAGPKRVDVNDSDPEHCFDAVASPQTVAATARAQAWARAGARADDWPEYPTNPFDSLVFIYL